MVQGSLTIVHEGSLIVYQCTRSMATLPPHSARRLGPMFLRGVAFALLAGLGMGGLLTGCSGANQAAEQQPLAVTGMVILPDSTALFGAEISTDPPTGYVSTDEAGRFWVALPRPATYTFIATHPDGRYRDMEGRITDVQVQDGQAPHLIIMMGRSQRMPLMDVGERASPALRRGKKRTG